MVDKIGVTLPKKSLPKRTNRLPDGSLERFASNNGGGKGIDLLGNGAFAVNFGQWGFEATFPFP